MAIKKSDLINSFTEEQKRQITAIEEMIDKKLKSEYIKGKKIVVSLDKNPHTRVSNEIKSKYKEAGWKIELESSQFDGSWFELS